MPEHRSVIARGTRRRRTRRSTASQAENGGEATAHDAPTPSTPRNEIKPRRELRRVGNLFGRGAIDARTSRTRAVRSSAIASDPDTPGGLLGAHDGHARLTPAPIASRTGPPLDNDVIDDDGTDVQGTSASSGP